VVTDEIITTLEKHISAGEREARFVFHSETAALFWARKALAVFDVKAVARERFIAWDVFKAENLSVFYPDKKPVTRAIRLLYARLLCVQNAAEPFLRALIPVQYARDGQLFAPSIARLLPGLKLWRAKLAAAETAHGSLGAFADFADFLLLEARYEAFLTENHLFEPSWEKPPFKDTAHEYFIFYPRLIEDFAEYEELLDAASVHKIESTLCAETDTETLTLYESERTELRAAALEIRRLHEEEGIPYEEIAVSCAELKHSEAYITRELDLYGIPYHARLGKPLAEYDAGAFFSRVNDCVREHFSWNSLEALLTSAALPWRCPNKNRALRAFGVKNNCVSGYREHGLRRDVWEEAFLGALSARSRGAAEERLRTRLRLFNHYRKLKIKITRMVNAKTSAALLRRVHDFFAHFFTPAVSAEHSDVIGRCVSELSQLALLEKLYPALAPSRPLDALLELLKERIHVRETEKSGVALFDYGVAASIPVRAHFILGANQSALTRLFRPLSHIRQDKRQLLALEDVDVSEDFLRAYIQTIDTQGRRTVMRISASRAAFSGAQIPHSYYLRPGPTASGARYVTAAPAPSAAGAYSAEKAWWKAARDNRRGGADGGAPPFPALLFAPQKEGFETWQFFSRGARFDMLCAALPETGAAAALVREALRQRKFRDRGQKTPDTKLRISPTSLSCFFICPMRWYYRDIVKLSPCQTRAKMLDDEGRGILYHEILHALFERIEREDRAFLAAKRHTYRLWAEEAALKAAKSFHAFRGPLAAPLIGAMAHSIARNIGRLLELEAASFDGWSAAALEQSCREERETVVLTGKIDRVSVSPDGLPAIVDYKTGKLPDKKDCVHTAALPLSDFQIPLYLRLYENTTNVTVEHALFTHPLRAEERHIVRPSGRTPLPREAYQETLDALESFIARHETAARALDFAPREARVSGGRIDFTRKKIPRAACAACDYRSVCRTLF
jgi:RecB family exonuclease